MIRLALTFAALVWASSASAHVTVWPKESPPGAHEKYAVRVPNEKSVDTTSLEVRFPEGLNVTGVEQKSEWLAEPIRDRAGKLTGVRWHGHLPPMQFAEFGLLAVNPTVAGDFRWIAVQGFADGTRVEWSGERGSKSPAPHTTIK